MTSASWLALAVFLAVAALDWIAVQTQNKALEYICKPGCMVALIAAAAALDADSAPARVVVVLALVFCLAGDVFLMLPGRQPGSAGPNLFLAGLGAFFVGHVAYVVAFWVDGVRLPGLAAGLVAVVLVVRFVGIRVVEAVKGSEEAALAGPVTAYIGVISAMVWSAFGTTDPLAAAGAVSFAASDSVIAWERFVRQRPWGRLFIIVTYHLAQAALVVSFG